MPAADEYWCECGLAANDPIHAPWHKILMHNRMAEAVAQEKADAEFAKKLQVHEARYGTQADSGPAQTGMEVGTGQTGAFTYAQEKGRRRR